MKFVRQTNRGESYLVDGEEYQVPFVYVEEPLLDFYVPAVERHGLAITVEEAPDGAFFDPGGMVMVGEARLWVHVRRQHLGCHLRSAESLLPLLRRRSRWIKEFEHGPAHTMVRGAFKHTLLTPETADAAADAIEAEWRARAEEADALWAQRDQALADHGIIDRRGEKNSRWPSERRA